MRDCCETRRSQGPDVEQNLGSDLCGYYEVDSVFDIEECVRETKEDWGAPVGRTNDTPHGFRLSSPRRTEPGQLHLPVSSREGVPESQALGTSLAIETKRSLLGLVPRRTRTRDEAFHIMFLADQ